ncbi:MerR family transcriptional regulator [Aureisphaera sp. CAU 1614]|uniref:MerR family transcriptional regulator n=1 Tax=Halomarinibacterium sedimenti TaxID=2857106 RepID=A0A9X1JXE1_9FLAO|nr:MerR family transcriptional regulator [Halomarinibacterium sedimenti]MBW2936482.1 MerR family transcriptional regulator [Halomarinibacterium sedimenti]
MFVKTQFSIKDLENLSGVKAHTIRIWEKRYNLLEPDRTQTNIRFYDLENLKRLLNVSFLYNEGYKISKIANLDEKEITQIIQEKEGENKEGYALQAFKTAMFDFDYHSFAKAYNKVAETKSFNQIFFDIFIPLLTDIGNLWSTGSIDPAHERFISEIIRQKIMVENHKLLENLKEKKAPQFALYLPHEEIHEIGLLFANYKLLSEGFTTIYLGNNIPLESLKHLLKHYNSLTFLSYFTVKPDHESVYEYIDRFENEISSKSNMQLWLMGLKVKDIDDKKLPKNVTVINSLKSLEEKITSLK